MVKSILLATALLSGGTTLPYYASAPAAAAANDTALLIVIHGYPRDANRTYAAALHAAQQAGADTTTLIVAPIFQVADSADAKCHFHGVPAATPTDALWQCGDWSDGGQAENAPITSFRAMDTLIAALLRDYPHIHRITLAGFSAGAQFVQHYAAFAAPAQAGVSVRYVIADPSAFLYFDSVRPLPVTGDCPTYNDWKFGTNDLPATLGRDAAQARAAYASAHIHYLEGALDTGSGPDAAYKLLERNCAAELQGPYRLQRGENYATYDARYLAHGAHTLTIVPGCAHAVTCVFPSKAGETALFGK